MIPYQNNSPIEEIKIDVQFGASAGSVKVKITGTEQRNVEEAQGWLSSWTAQQTYTVYIIETISTLDSHEDVIPFSKKTYKTFRRFSEFEKLLAYLRDQENLRGIVIPELPQKSYLNNLDKQLIEARRTQLEAFLEGLVGSPDIRKMAALRYFLLTQDQIEHFA